MIPPRVAGRAVLAAVVAIPFMLAGGPTLASLSDPAKQNVEWIAVVRPSDVAALEPLRSFRAGQGLTTAIWTTSDLDESHGGHSGTHLRSALVNAWNSWTTKPKYVVVCTDNDLDAPASAGQVSDCSWAGPQVGELGRWTADIVGLWPCMDLNDDGIAEVSVGRLPFSNAAAFSAYAAKVQAYDAALQDGTRYRYPAYVIQDEDVDGNSAAWVRELADAVVAGDVSLIKPVIRKSTLPCCASGTEARDALNQKWGDAPSMVVVMGNTGNWFSLAGVWDACAGANGWSVAQLPAGTNAYSPLLAMLCGVGATDHPVATACDATPPIVEQLLSSPLRGSVLVVAPTRTTYQYYNQLLARHLVARKNEGLLRWGDLYARAMSGALAEDPTALDHVFQYVILGDPATMASPLPSGGSGCPVLETRTSAGWVAENTVLGRSARSEFGTDVYRLGEAPSDEQEQLMLRIVETEQEYTTLDHVRLLSFDHPEGDEGFSLDGALVSGRRLPARRVVDSRGADVTALVNGGSSGCFIAEPGETLLVDLADDAAATAGPGASRLDEMPYPPDPPPQEDPGDPFLIDDGDKGGGVPPAPASSLLRGAQPASVDAAILGGTGVLVQVPDDAGEWRTIVHHYPRENFSSTAFDSVRADVVRLVFLDRHRVRFLGRARLAAEAGRQRILPLLAAEHSRLGSIAPALRHAGDATAPIVPGDTLTFSFSAAPAPVGMVRDYFLLLRGVYTSARPFGLQAPERLGLPLRFALLPNQPNPFRTSTVVRFELPERAHVTLTLFDAQGRKVQTLADREFEPGFREVRWDRRTPAGESARPGVYFYRIRAGSFTAERKLVVLP